MISKATEMIKRVVLGDFPVQGVKVEQTYHQDDKTLRDKPTTSTQGFSNRPTEVQRR